MLRLLPAFLLVFLLSPLAAQAGSAALFLSPAAGSFVVGSTFDVSIVLDTKGEAVNTVEVELRFPPEKIQLVSPSVGQSIVQIWPAPPAFSNREGRLYFVGGIPSPGVNTSQGVVLTLRFRVIAPGQGQITFGDRVRVLANDGLGSDILSQAVAGFYRFSVAPSLGPKISSPTHPDQERWYADPNPVFVWTSNFQADGYSYSLDRNPSGIPDTVSEGTETTTAFQNLDNGFWYFHLREKAGGQWGGVSHFVVKIDSQLPADFTASVQPGRRTKDRNPIFRFFTTDALSGLDHYEMKVVPISKHKIDETFFFEVTSPYQSPNFEPGRYQVIIRAVDRAGNTRDVPISMTILGLFNKFIDRDGVDFIFFFLPWGTLVDVLSILAILLLILLILIWRKHRYHLWRAVKEDVGRLSGRGGGGPAATLIFFLIFIASVYVVDAQSLPAPTISVAPQTYYVLDDVLYLEGRAQPKSKVDLYFEKSGAQPIRIFVTSNSNGEWFLAEKLELSSGEWLVRARLDGDPPSDWSNPRVIRAVMSGVILGGLKIRYLPIVLALFSIIIATVISAVYVAIRMRRLKDIQREAEFHDKETDLEKRLKQQERQVANAAIEQDFAELRRRLNEEIEHLEKKTAERKLTPEEEDHRDRLLKQLREVEDSIERRVKELH